MKTEEVTDDQLSVVYSLTQAGINSCADFGVVSHSLDDTGSCRQGDPGPDSIVSWEACWRVFRTATIMCDLAPPAASDRYASAFRARVETFPGQLALVRVGGHQCRAEHWEAEQRRQALFHNSNPELSAHVPRTSVEHCYP